MTQTQKSWLVRLLLGAALGVAAHLVLGYFLGAFNFAFGSSHFSGFVFPGCNFPRDLEGLGVLLSFVLFALLGAEAGVATLPFDDRGAALALKSLLHFVLMALTLWVWVILNFPQEPLPGLAFTFLFPFALLYVLVWAIRWLVWYFELGEIKRRLGLTGKETLK